MAAQDNYFENIWELNQLDTPTQKKFRRRIHAEFTRERLLKALEEEKTQIVSAFVIYSNGMSGEELDLNLAPMVEDNIHELGEYELGRLCREYHSFFDPKPAVLLARQTPKIPIPDRPWFGGYTEEKIELALEYAPREVWRAHVKEILDAVEEPTLEDLLAVRKLRDQLLRKEEDTESDQTPCPDTCTAAGRTWRAG